VEFPHLTRTGLNLEAIVEPILDYKIFLVRLTSSFNVFKDLLKVRGNPDPQDFHRIVGILFAPPYAPLAHDEIVPRITQFHHRSADYIDFFFAGYLDPKAEKPEDAAEISATVPGAPSGWMYSDEAFNSFRADFEKRSKGHWRYSGEVDLVLADAVLRHGSKEAEVDHSALLVLDLDRAKRDGVIETVPKFFENIFQYAEDPRSKLALQDFSTKAANKAIGAALGDWFLSMLPKETGKIWKRGRHFVIQ
jgi:hypothetical protein